jgi:hypothetical protein
MAFVSSGTWNCANDHSELKYLGKTPLMNDKDEPALAPAEIKEVPLLPADGSAVPEPVGDVVMPATSARASSNRGLRPNTWTVPLSLERTSHCVLGENDMLYMAARSAPRRSCYQQDENLYYHISQLLICGGSYLELQLSKVQMHSHLELLLRLKH